MKKAIKFAAVALMATAFVSNANDSQSEFDSVKQAIKSNPNLSKVRNIQVIRKIDTPSSLSGFYEVNIDGQNLILDKDAKYAVIGDVFNLEEMVNLSAQARSGLMAKKASAAISKLSNDDFISYKPQGDVKGSLYVFTDPTCGYCQRLHNEINEYLENGVEVKYIPYPRSGYFNQKAKGFTKTAQIWCADDRQEALTFIKSGGDESKYSQENYPNTCTDAIKRGYDAGREIGLTGTPFLYLSNGISIPGYQPAGDVSKLF
ncbi:DsbC family protein [Thalassotalea aquiviva]|uniref:DsbC family protein n=1 Tax=Thalassotalea aquiviva TaxID=3242415 RepID=UPI00352B86FB